MLFPEKLMLKLPSGMLSRIDAVCENRSDWVRAAIEAALGGSVIVEAPVVEAPLVSGAGRRAAKVEAKSAAVAEVQEKVAAIKPKSVAAPVPKSGRWDADKVAVLSELDKAPALVRKLAERLGWAVPRVEKIADMLIEDGEVTASGGLLVRADG